jgi:hypothetical protein
VSALIACVRLSPWALVVAEQDHPGVPLAVLDQGGRVQHVGALALQAGVTPGLRLSAARSRCPALQAEVLDAPALATRWRELQELLYARFSDRVAAPSPGLALLTATPLQARELAALLQAPVGLAASQEVAQLAALRARPGTVQSLLPHQEPALLPLTPLAHLQVLGLDAEQIQQLTFLGLGCLGDLLAWSAGQRAAFLGAALSSRLGRFVRGVDRTARVPRWTPGELLEVHLHLDAPLQEPAQLDAALNELMAQLWPRLRGRTARYLQVQAQTVGGQLSATRLPKWPLDARGLQRVAAAAVQASGALPLGIDALRVQLSGFGAGARQLGLWPGVRELDAVGALLERFPQALVRVQWLDTHAYVHDAQYRWVDGLSGAERAGQPAVVQAP